MRFIAKAVLIAAGALVVIAVIFVTEHTLRTNRCSPGFDGQIIKSEADAIAAAKKWILKERFNIPEVGGAENLLRIVEQTPNCCFVKRSETFFGVVVWEAHLSAKRSEDEHEMLMSMTACGELFADSVFKIRIR